MSILDMMTDLPKLLPSSGKKAGKKAPAGAQGVEVMCNAVNQEENHEGRACLL